jgi:hypothetical protein
VLTSPPPPNAIALTKPPVAPLLKLDGVETPRRGNTDDRNTMRRGLAAALAILAIVALACAAVVAVGRDGHLVDVRAFAGRDLAVSTPIQAATWVEGALPGVVLELSADRKAVRLPVARGVGSLHLQDVGATDTHDIRVRLVPVECAYWSAAATVLFFLTLPALFVRRRADDPTTSALALTLSERGGGLSLARVQFMIWFLPSLAMLAAVSVPLLAMPDIDATFAALFGLAGLTTALGTATSPERPDDPVPPPEARQVVEDWNNTVDFSRLQYLAISLVGAAALLAVFLVTLRVPVVPQGLLALLGASQATYLGTKAVKVVKASGSKDP